MVRVIRSIAAVLLGYVVFAGAAYALFRFSGQAPHAHASPAFMLASIVSGVVFACLGGYLAARLAGHHPRAHGVAVALLLALGAAASLAATRGHGAVWSQVAALVLMAPSAALGGMLRARSRSSAP